MIYKESTKIKPLLFFETFFNNEVVLKYEEMFYHPINDSQINYKEEGYKKYYKDCYVDDEPFEYVIEKFNENISDLLNFQILISKKLLLERRDEIEYINISSDIFLQRQINVISELKEKTIQLKTEQSLFIKALVNIEKFIDKSKAISNNKIEKVEKFKTNKPYFDPIVKRYKLKKIYDIALDNKVFDEEIVSENIFLDIFTSNNPESLEGKIHFSCNNQIATFFLDSIQVFFNSLSHSQISKSKSFYNKNGKPLNQNDLYKAKNLYKKDITKIIFTSISKDLAKISKK
jgi:hypothetical protein